MLQLDAKFGVLVPHFVKGQWALSGNRYSSAYFGAKAMSRGKVSRMSVDWHRRKWVDR